MKNKKIKKVIVLGSGALKIGQAGEFDYSGSQAIKALKEEGIKTVLINPNIATIQTSKFLADEIYFLPVTPYFVEKVIAKERPDGIFLSFGGQTGLNCGIRLNESGVLKKYNVEVLGTPVEIIDLTEDRQKFADFLHSMDIPTPPSGAATNMEKALKIADKIGYPVIARAAFTLGGQKSGVAFDKEQLEGIVKEALSFSPQVLIEKYLHHFKEIEYEVVRDNQDNCITVCNMENFDPLGIHTGESIVVAPSQTLTNKEYHDLRLICQKIVKKLGIIGECNVQFALNPKPKGKGLDFFVIEMNARLSRSSALASKATGYPLAYVAAKLALGYSMLDIKNQVTQVTTSFFEPALDYIVVKIPRWDLEKFKGVTHKIGSSMKSVGEVMGIGRTFEEALQKAVRMIEIGKEGITDNGFPKDKTEFKKYLEIATPKRLFAVAEAMKRGFSIQELYKMTGIDPWFLDRMKSIVDLELELANAKKLTKEKLLELKQNGFSDKRIGIIRNKTELEIRKMRLENNIKPFAFSIDTLAGEFPAKTNYLYMTYNGMHNDVTPLGKSSVMVLGSGCYRIGSSVEFDWTCVNTAVALKKHKRKSIIVNCNPETVSTDYDMSDRLYFEEVSFERVADIYEFENSEGVVISTGGQTPNNLAGAFQKYKVNVLGTKPEDIDRAEDRSKFSKLLDDMNIPQPRWNKFTTIKEAKKFTKEVGFPVLVRPSYVLSGSAMNICYNDVELEKYIEMATDIGKEHPVTVSKFMTQTKEIELDAVAQNGEIQVYAISEHIENAGVHSGDASIVFPPQKVYILTEKKIIRIAKQIAKALNVSGPFNIQFLAKENDVYVIETNLRASRTFPFISKVTGVNFAEKIVDSFYGKAKKEEIEYPQHVLVKVPQFSFSRLEGADPILGVEMSSTGEVACFGEDVEEALLKAMYATDVEIKGTKALFSISGLVQKKAMLESARFLKDLGFKIYGTEDTAKFFNENGVSAEFVYKVNESKDPNILDLINKKKVSLVIMISKEPGERVNTPEFEMETELKDGYLIRRATVDNNIPLVTDLKLAKIFIQALAKYSIGDLKIKSWNEYL